MIYRHGIEIEDDAFNVSRSTSPIDVYFSPEDKIGLRYRLFPSLTEAKGFVKELRGKGHHVFVYKAEATGERDNIVTEEAMECPVDRRLYLLLHEPLHLYFEDVRDWVKSLMIVEATCDFLAVKLAEEVAEEIYGMNFEEVALVKKMHDKILEGADIQNRQPPFCRKVR